MKLLWVQIDLIMNIIEGREPVHSATPTSDKEDDSF